MAELQFGQIDDEQDEHNGALVMFIGDTDKALILNRPDAVKLAKLLIEYAETGHVPRNVWDA